MAPLDELLAARERACRLTPDRALQTIEEAEEFLHDRGLLTLMPDCSLPSLFGACHEEPYKPGGRGFGSWPRTKYPWRFGLERRPGAHWLRVHRGKGLLVTDRTAGVLDPLCRRELALADQGALGPEARRLVVHLSAAGPTLLEELKEELELSAKTLRSVREPLERVGALVGRTVVLEDPHRHTTELARWDQRFPEAAPDGGLPELVVAGVRAAVVAPEREIGSWFSWTEHGVVEALVASGRLVRPDEGWLTVP